MEALTLDDADSGTATDDDGIDSILQQLEAHSDEEEVVSNGVYDEGEAAPVHPSTWSALQYATFMTGTYQFVKEKHKVKGYLAAELARAEAEIAEEGTDATKRPSLEGDIEHYSVAKQKARRLNKKSPGFLSAVRIIWDATQAEMVDRLGESPTATVRDLVGSGDGEEVSAGIDKAAFVCLMIKVHYLIICPPVDRQIANKNACNDWAKDNVDGGPLMGYESFVESIFELVDLWTETLEAEEYDALAMMIAKGVTTEIKVSMEQQSESKGVDNALKGEQGGKRGEGGTEPAVEAGTKKFIVTRSFTLKSDDKIVYDPKITKKPVYMEDLTEEQPDDDFEDDYQDDYQDDYHDDDDQDDDQDDDDQDDDDQDDVDDDQDDDDAANADGASVGKGDGLRRVKEQRRSKEARAGAEGGDDDAANADGGSVGKGDGLKRVNEQRRSEKEARAGAEGGDDDAANADGASVGKGDGLRRVKEQRRSKEARAGAEGDDDDAANADGASVGKGDGLRRVKEHRRNNETRAGAEGEKKSKRKLAHNRFGGAYRFKESQPSGSAAVVPAHDGGMHPAVSSLTQNGRHSKIALFSMERINATIAKIYYSKMQVDQKLLQRDGKLTWTEKCRRKKDQRMDRFVLQYNIRQFGTKKLARRNLLTFCRSVTRLAPESPRITVFAELTGVPIMIHRRPYVERMVEFRPFACSDFIIPMLAKLCPPGEKMDRWLGNAKAPVAVTLHDFTHAVRETCPDIPTECPAYVGFLIKAGTLAERFEKRCRDERLNKPFAGRLAIDLDEGLLIAMPVMSAEEEYLNMTVTLNAIRTLIRWMRRVKHRRKKGREKSSSQNQQNRSQFTRVKTARKTRRKSHPKLVQQKLTSSSQLELPTAASETAVGGIGSAGLHAGVVAETHKGGEQMDSPHHSPRARQKLEQAKVLDKELLTSQAAGGG